MKKAKVVLVVDDDIDFLEEIHALLCERNYTVITCSDPEQVLALTRSYLPDQIILDLAMPHIRGENLLAVIRKRHPEIPVLICTGVPNVEVHGLLHNGASGVFQKPFSSDLLFRTLDQAA